MSLRSRRQFLAGSAVLGAGMLTGARTLAQQKRTVTFITPFGYLIGYAPTLNAQAGGHFAKEGIELNVLPGKGSAVAVQQVIAGRALYGRGDPLAAAAEPGQAVRVVMG